ncbi:hypothetical protein HD554DRAFT_2145206 [Boletus coccyginus]|nr:hypothetical protein HD554DRAFT_2145206 [Boletus coccyginus]
MKTTLWKHRPCLIKWTCNTSFQTPPLGSLNASAYLHYGCVNWYEFSPIALVQSRSIPCSLTSRLRRGFMPLMTSFIQVYPRLNWRTWWSCVRTRCAPLIVPSLRLQSFVPHSMQTLRRRARLIKSSKNSSPCFVRLLIFDHASNRLTIVNAGEIGFRVPKDRLPWSTLEGELEKRGYTILHWPQGVLREKDKGVYSLGAEEADKLYRALFVDVGRVQFVRRDDENGEGTVSLPETARSDDAFESHRSCVPLTGKQPRFRVMTQESYSVERPQKRPQHV